MQDFSKSAQQTPLPLAAVPSSNSTLHEPPPPPFQYDACFHPRFGVIKCIRALQPIAAGEEIFVTYGYEVGASPVLTSTPTLTCSPRLFSPLSFGLSLGSLLYEYGLTSLRAEKEIDAPPWFVTKARAHLATRSRSSAGAVNI